jgi:hypothetical protein
MNVAQGIDHHFGRQTEKYEILFLSIECAKIFFATDPPWRAALKRMTPA